MNKEELLEWASSVRPGDYIATCEGCNRQVAEVEEIMCNGSLFEVMFTDTKGRMHCCPGGGCARPAETPEQVTAYFQSLVDAEWARNSQSTQRIVKALLAGKPIVDEHGELLPEFDKK